MAVVTAVAVVVTAVVKAQVPVVGTKCSLSLFRSSLSVSVLRSDSLCALRHVLCRADAGSHAKDGDAHHLPRCVQKHVHVPPCLEVPAGNKTQRVHAIQERPLHACDEQT